MGYNMYLMDYSVHIKKEDFADALNAYLIIGSLISVYQCLFQVEL